MLSLCIYVCKYICVSVHTCLIVQNMYHCSLPVTFKRQVGFYLHSFSRPSSRRQLIVLEKGNVKRHLCLASLLVDWRGSSLPTDEEFPFSVPPVLACFVCIMVVLPYRNLLLLCGGISKPVVHYRSLISPLHCSLCAPRVWAHLHGPDPSCAWWNDDWNRVKCCVRTRSPQGLKSHY